MSDIGNDSVYRLNEHDEIVFVNRGFDEFALANDAPGVTSTAVIGRPLWDFLSDATTIRIYEEILKQVRGGRRVRFPFRCDSPDSRREMELDIRSSAGFVEFRARPLGETHRPCQSLLDRRAPRASGTIPICGWCKRIQVDRGWSEIEEAVARLRLFHSAVVPAIRHGICPDCHSRATSLLRA